VARIRPAIITVLAALSLLAVTCASAQAATSATHLTNRSGTYNGQINQVQPKKYTGHIHFIVRHGRITALRFTAGTLCGVLWVVDTDHALPTFPLRVTSRGAFSYRGTVGGRQIQLKGKLKGNRAHGTFFQTFPWGGTTCTMGQAASFTATR
jgi:hypothetical protein